MLTPQFKISQSPQQIIVVIRLPYVKITSCEFFIEHYSFKFYLKPYLLNLTFEQSLQEMEQPAKAVYYHQKYLLEVYLNKKTKGQNFENLNLLSKILNKNKAHTKNPHTKKTLIQPVQQQPSVLVLNQDKQSINNPFTYGFCNNYSKVFTNLEEECCQIFSLNPQNIELKDRYELSLQILQSAFDQQSYLYDKYENTQQIERIVSSKQIIEELKKKIDKMNSKQLQTHQQFKSAMKLPNKQLIVDKSQQNNIIKQILSLSFCYLYQFLCMDGQMSVQSAKTINNSSAVLGCCIDYSDLSMLEVIKDSSKRCITYSLYKDVKICNKVLNILKDYFTSDFIKMFLSNLRFIFQKSEPRYLLNTIYIDDFLIYFSRMNLQSTFKKIREEVIDSIKISEADLDLQFELEQSDGQKQIENVEKQNIQAKRNQQ